MNNLSWFLYFADVIPNLAGVFWFFGLAILFGWFIRLAVIEATDYPFQGVVEKKASADYHLLFSVAFFLVVANLIPSKETIYLIAGSEAGEAVVTSEEGKEIVSDIHQVIKHQLNQLKGNKQ